MQGGTVDGTQKAADMETLLYHYGTQMAGYGELFPGGAVQTGAAS